MKYMTLQQSIVLLQGTFTDVRDICVTSWTIEPPLVFFAVVLILQEKLQRAERQRDLAQSDKRVAEEAIWLLQVS